MNYRLTQLKQLTCWLAILLVGLTKLTIQAQPPTDTLPPLATIQARIDQLKTDSSKIDQYSKMGSGLINAYRDADAKLLTERALILAKKTRNKRDIAFFLSRLGDLNTYASRYPEAMRFYQQSLDAATSVRDTNRLIYAQLHVGQVYNSMGELAIAEKYLLQSLHLERVGKLSLAMKLDALKH